MKFAEPLWLLAGLIACALLAWAWRGYDRRQRAALASFASSHLHAQLTTSFSVIRRRWKRGLFLLSLALLFIALARPQAGYRWEETHRQGIEILFAVDTSKSMLTPDVKPNRLTRAKLAVDDFVSHLDGDGVGLVAFAGNAFLQCPITLDYNAFNESLAALDTNTIPRGGTDISSAIREAEAALQNRPGTDKILILLTDGEDLEGSAVDTARDAAKAGLKIYTVGVGTPNGDLIPLPAEDGGGFVKDESGQYVKSHLDASTLEAIAKATGGLYAPLGPQGQGLDTIYEKALAPLTKHNLSSRRERVYIERYQWFLAPSLLLLLASLLVGTRRNVRRPVPARQASRPGSRRRLVPQAAAALLGLALLLPFSQAKASVSEAQAAYKKGDFATAAREFAASAQHHSQKDILQFDAGAAAYKAGQYQQAADDFQRALSAAQPNQAAQVAAQEDAYYNLGNTLYRTGQKTEQGNVQQTIQAWQQAIKSYDASLELRKDDADAKFNRDFVQKKLDALKKKQQQQQQQNKQQNQQQNQQNQQNQANQNQQQKQNQSQQAKNQQNQGSNSKNQQTAQNGSSQNQQKQSGNQQQQQSQANNNGNQQNGQQNQQKNPGQQQNQSTAQNSGNQQQQQQQQQQQGAGSQPQQQQGQQAQNGNSPSPQNPGNQQQQPSGQGSSLAQNGGKLDETGHTSDQAVPGQMSKQEARQLLDSVRDEQKRMPGSPVARNGGDNSPDQPFKDW